MKKLFIILAAAGTVLFSPALRADDYPSKPITIVAVFGAGSASDTICRIFPAIFDCSEIISVTLVDFRRQGKALLPSQKPLTCVNG